MFAAEARDVKPEYAPKTVNTDGWAGDAECLPLVVSHHRGGALLPARVPQDPRPLAARLGSFIAACGTSTAPPTGEEFRRLMSEFQQWCATQTWTASVGEMLEKLWAKTECYATAYDHPGCHRTSNAVDRPMNRLCRLMYASRGLHGHQGSSELRLRGWALLHNFRPYAPRGKCPRAFESPAHRLKRQTLP